LGACRLRRGPWPAGRGAPARRVQARLADCPRPVHEDHGTADARCEERLGGLILQYVSTRGAAPAAGFLDVMLAGLAPDGGLYVPETWPPLDAAALEALQGCDYAEVALAVMRGFVGGEIPDRELAAMIDDAYAGFGHRAVAPLRQLDGRRWLLELFHGPTLAFKDVALQLLGRLMDRELVRRGERATVIGATSGDTGSAAIAAFSGCKAADIHILHPHGRVSEVQRRQMTTVIAPNVHNIAVEGTFDDCQKLVKALFADERLNEGSRV